MPKTKPSRGKIKTRIAVVRYIDDMWSRPKQMVPDKHYEGGQSFRYGLCNLRALLDYMYGGPPKNKSEELNII